MALENWLQALRAKETYRAGVYSVAEYVIERRIFGNRLPPVPRADPDRHIIVMEVVGGTPVFVATLTMERPYIHVPAQEADRMLFISVEMRPQPLDVAAASGTYRLADGTEVRCEIGIEWRVADAEAFWKGSVDPVVALRLRVIEAARRFLGSQTASALLSDKVDLERELVASIADRTITIIKLGVETHVQGHATVPGTKIQAVSAVIEPSKSLSEHLIRVAEKFIERGGLADRLKINQLLEHDQTYSPYSVSSVARALGMHLLENFYTQPYPEAMRALADAFEAKKAELRPDESLKAMAKTLERAKEMGLDKTFIQSISVKIGEKLLDSLDRPDTPSPVSNQTFLQALVGPTTQTVKINSDTDSRHEVDSSGQPIPKPSAEKEQP
jgi:hypothetical protein